MEREHLEDRLARLERERSDADDAYNTCLTAVDRAMVQRPDFPHPPPQYDETQITPLNQSWNILPDGEPSVDGSLKGRLRAFIWRLVGPSLVSQKAFNAAVVDHLNRNVVAHRESQRAIASTISLIEGQTAALRHFHAALLSLLQRVTLFVDTKDRSVGGQIQVLAAALGALTDDWMKHWESLRAGGNRNEAQYAALELSQKMALLQQTTLLLKRDVERLFSTGLPTIGRAGALEQKQPAAGDRERASTSATDPNAFNYVGFEDRFRGSQPEIRQRLSDYVPLFAGATNVLDLGCGRGELLDLFREAGISARGIDVNRSMVDVCLERGLIAETADAVGHLQEQPDGSLGGIVAIQVVEHLEPAYLARLIELAFHKLAPGAPLVLETLNPACWLAFFESYIRDVTHRWPLHPDTLHFLVQAGGFSSVTVQFRAPVANADKLQHIPTPNGQDLSEPDPLLLDLVDIVNAHADKLNARLFTYMDYAVVARR